MFFILNNFLIGYHYVTNMAAQFELNLRRFYCGGEKRGFTFQKFVNLHKVQHIISDGLMEFGYSGVDDNSKLHILRNGIKTNAIDACKAAILASLDIQGDFDIAARNFLDFIAIAPSL